MCTAISTCFVLGTAPSLVALPISGATLPLMVVVFAA